MFLNFDKRNLGLFNMLIFVYLNISIALREYKYNYFQFIKYSGNK